LLILDDWGPDRLNPNQRRDLMEIVEDRYGAGSTLITSQLPVEAWHDVIDEPTFADAILDRLVHNAYRSRSMVPRCAIRRRQVRHYGSGRRNGGCDGHKPTKAIKNDPVTNGRPRGARLTRGRHSAPRTAPPEADRNHKY